MLSRVEEIALARGVQKKITLSGEKIGVIVVDSFPALGTLAALRFLEWLQENPEGVISLPTGKSPQYFIREVTRFIAGWREKSIQRELAEGGVDYNCQPDQRGLHFVQIDEFYPISPEQHNSFYYYVNRYYLKGFDLDPAKALL
ncbi:MAG: glucosamine-6-phosphate deaminase, partial [Spirochaeta sp.]|nr:glucosamine-6-phosphate deaminase [Spirochaeta sp.]